MYTALLVFNVEHGMGNCANINFQKGSVEFSDYNAGEGCLFAIIRNFLLNLKFPQTICIHWLEKIGSKDVTEH